MVMIAMENTRGAKVGLQLHCEILLFIIAYSITYVHCDILLC